MAIAPPGQERGTSPRQQGRWGLWTLCGWGTAAAAALLAAALTGLTDGGGERLRAALTPPSAPPPVHAVAAIEPPARPTPKADALPRPATAPLAPVRTTAVARPEPAADPVARREAERLAGMVRELAADRDRLGARVASLEEQLADVTGSIARRDAELASREAREAAASRERVAGPPDIPILTPPVGSSLGSDVVFAPETVAALPDSGQTPAENASSQQHPPPDQLKWNTKAEPVAPAEPTAPAAPPSGTTTPESARAQDAAAGDPAPLVDVPLPRMRTAAVPSRAEHAVDLGGAFSRQTVTDRWGELKVRFAPQLRGLRPLVGHVNRFGYAPYRLVVGPLPDEAAARQLCARLSEKINCLPTRFTGDRLAQP